MSAQLLQAFGGDAQVGRRGETGPPQHPRPGDGLGKTVAIPWGEESHRVDGPRDTLNYFRIRPAQHPR